MGVPADQDLTRFRGKRHRSVWEPRGDVIGCPKPHLEPVGLARRGRLPGLRRLPGAGVAGVEIELGVEKLADVRVHGIAV